MSVNTDELAALVATLPAVGFVGPYTAVQEDAITWISAEDGAQDIGWDHGLKLAGDIVRSVGGCDPRVEPTIRYLVAAANAVPLLIAELTEVRAQRLTPEFSAALDAYVAILDEYNHDDDSDLVMADVLHAGDVVRNAYRALKEQQP